MKGAFAVDGGSTSFLGQALKETGMAIPNGGFDTEPLTLSNIASGATDFTIYQDPYLQGFLPTLYLYLYNISGGTIVPPDTDTGLSFITKSNYSRIQAGQPVPGLDDRARSTCRVRPARSRTRPRPPAPDNLTRAQAGARRRSHAGPPGSRPLLLRLAQADQADGTDER